MKPSLNHIFSVQTKEPERISHSHHSPELVYCVDGNGTIEIHGKITRFGTGTYYIVHPGTHHSEWKDRPSQIIYFSFKESLSNVTEGIFTDYDGTVLSITKRILREWQENQIQKEEMLQSLLIQILIEAKRASLRNKSEAAFSAVLRYIHENMDQDIDFVHLAEQQNYSYNHFRRLFKANTGLSPHQYVLHSRIEKAKFLMELNPQTSLTQIYLSCGFSSASQFTNIFLTKVGMTPSEYKGSINT